MKTRIRSIFLTLFVTAFAALYTPIQAQKNQMTAANNAKRSEPVAKPRPAEHGAQKSKPEVKTSKSNAQKTSIKSVATTPSAALSLRKGLEQLKSRNISEAKTAFKNARKSAAKGQKKQYRVLTRISRKYDRRYFRTLNKSSKLQQAGDFKGTILIYNQAESKFRSIKRRKVADLLKPVDDYLMKQHNAETKRFNEQRITAYNKAIADAKRDMQSNPRNARNRLLYAKSQMNPTEVVSTKVDALIRDANYNIAITEGDKWAKNGQLEAALSLYYTAQSNKDTPEIRSKILLTRAKLYTKYLASADYRAANGFYECAAKDYLTAKSYTDNPAEVNEHMLKQYDKLFAYGNELFEMGKYADAVKWYDLAGLFASSSALSHARNRANNYLQFKIYMDKANAELAAGNANSAYNAVNEAVRYRTTDESEALKRKLDAFMSNMRSARANLDAGDTAKALQAAQTAQSYVPQSVEARNITASINTYRQKVDAARSALSKKDRVTARTCLSEAQKIANTKEVRDLSTEANKQ